MTLYEEIYYNTPNLTKFYRYEGFGSRPYFQFQGNVQLTNILNYIYFSKTEKHHQYYVQKRLKQLISQQVLEGTDIELNKKSIIDSGVFTEIERCIENYPFEDTLISIEFSLSPIINQLLVKNTISSRTKQSEDRRIEKVDQRGRYGGGYGFCEDWLRVFEILTYFYSYHRITTEDMLNFLYMYRRNIIERRTIFNPTSFILDPKSRVIKLNDKMYCDFTKYELMDALGKIVEQQLYFPESIFGNNPDEKIRKLIQDYIEEREQLLELTNSVYKKRIRNKTLN